MMIFNQNKKTKDAAHVIFTKIVDQARNPIFYSQWDVADSLDGRFDLIILHVALVADRFEQSDGNKKIALMIRYIQEVLFDNMDLSLREMGVGDMSVGKKVKVMAEAYYGRKAAYQKALRADDDLESLKLALIKNVFRDNAPDGVILDKFTSYINKQHRCLENQTDDNLISAKLIFEDVV